MTVKEQLFAKIEELEALLEEAQCDGMQLAECGEVFDEFTSMVGRLTEAVDYYLD
jgi:hypothetical protein